MTPHDAAASVSNTATLQLSGNTFSAGRSSRGPTRTSFDRNAVLAIYDSRQGVWIRRGNESSHHLVYQSVNARDTNWWR